MPGLLSILKKVKQKEKEVRILVLGLDNAGKTTAVKRLIGEEVTKTAPTLGFDIHTISLTPSSFSSSSPSSSSSSSSGSPDDRQDHNPTTPQHTYTAHIWDIGGQTTIRAYWKNYFEETDGVIWVVDSSDTLRLLACATELKSLLSSERLLGATLLVLANKQDVEGALSAEEIESTLQLNGEQTHHYKVVGCSAFTSSEGIKEGVAWMIDDIASRVFLG